jgi:anti-sigma regulatory factor (Ser/Thr protein kinase)
VISALLLPQPESAPRARRALSALEPLMSGAAFADLRLLVSELVTNSVEHSGVGPNALIQLDIHLSEERVRVEVTDPGPGFDPPHMPPRQRWDAEYGRGLLIVDALAAAWGVESGERSTVWFELAVPGLVAA